MLKSILLTILWTRSKTNSPILFINSQNPPNVSLAPDSLYHVFILPNMVFIPSQAPDNNPAALEAASPTPSIIVDIEIIPVVSIFVSIASFNSLNLDLTPPTKEDNPSWFEIKLDIAPETTEYASDRNPKTFCKVSLLSTKSITDFFTFSYLSFIEFRSDSKGPPSVTTFLNAILILLNASSNV